MNRNARVTIVLLLALVATACTGSGDAKTTDAPRRAGVPFVPIDPNGASVSDRAISAAQLRLRSVPNDDTARLALALGYLQKVRETADPALYGKAGSLLDDLGRRRPRDPAVAVALGTLALARHRFRAARTLGERATRLAPGNPSALGVLVDANNELGRSNDALEATQRMADARPGLAALSRVSYARELRGDVPGAIEAMQGAISAAGARDGENVAYVQVLLGNLLLGSGDVAGAEAAYSDAEVSFPGFPAARAGHAQVLIARAQPEAAAQLLADVIDVQPLAQYAIARGDALMAAGRNVQAKTAYELVRVIGRLYAANGVNSDLELALFDADHDPGPRAVSAARRALADRPSRFAHDVLAWNLFRTGQLDEAARESRAALALGTLDAQEQFHAAAIAFARHDRAAARRHLTVVLAGNPRFSAFLFPEVQRLAGKVGLSVPPPASSEPLAPTGP